MKFVFLISLMIVVACAPRPTLKELEEEALVTGDWEAVERREDLIKERLESSVLRNSPESSAIA
jgi:hypothetical protein